MYKKHHIKITREGYFLFYITFTDKTGISSYDGYYNSDTASMNEAIEEALRGGMLI